MHELPPGHHISGKGGRLRIIETRTGKLVKDLGETSKKNRFERREGAKNRSELAPAIPDIGWIAYTSWSNDSGQPIAYFTSTWVVPPAPAADDSQVIFLFNGLQQTPAGPYILQPVLQWGVSAAGGGKYWTIANWYVNGQGGSAVHKPPVQVNPGDLLQGILTLTAQSGNEFSYTSSFVGYPQLDIPANEVDQLAWACETLECYGKTYEDPVPQCLDYPDTDMTRFYDIALQVGATPAAATDAILNWGTTTAYSTCGQSTVVVSNASPGGAVELHYRSAGPPAAAPAAVNRDAGV